MLERIPLSYVFAIILLIGAVVFVPNYRYSRGYDGLLELASLQIEDRTHLAEQMHELSHLSQRNVTNDYTYWDDMIEFADNERDNEWGDENLGAVIEAFGIDGIWVVDRNDTLRYGIFVQDGEIAESTELPVSIAIVKATVARDGISEFHRYIGGRLATVMTAALVPTADFERETPPQGYFITLSFSDANDATTLSERAGINASFHDIADAPRAVGLLDVASGLYAFEIAISDWDGVGVAHLRGERQSLSVVMLLSLLRAERRTNYLFLGILSLFVAAFVWVNVRARTRAELIAADMTVDLRNANTNLEKRVAERTHDLEEDIKRRAAAEAQLKKRTEELERINKVMVARELRVVELKQKLKENSKPQE